MTFIFIYSRYTPKLYRILQLSVLWLHVNSVRLHVRNVSGKKSFKSSRGGQSSHKEEEVQYYFMLLK